MKTAFFDLKGTLVHHKTLKRLPLMNEILKSLRRDEWSLVILSSFEETTTRQLLKHADVDTFDHVLSSSGLGKGECVLQHLKDAPCEASFFVDDKPANLESVRGTCGAKVRVIGFVGSRKYTPHLSAWCAENQVELALSAIDLCEGLPVRVDSGKALFNSAKQYDEASIAALLAGADHPFSSTAGDTRFADHRAAQAEIFGHRKIQDFETIWRNIAWITCNECLWKALVLSVCAALSLDRSEVLGHAYKHYQYTDALRKYVAERPSPRMLEAFEHALDVMQKGIAEIGVEAETCRMINRSIERNRLELAKVRVAEIFDRPM